jgi:hypothetical protein
MIFASFHQGKEEKIIALSLLLCANEGNHTNPTLWMHSP